MYYVRLLQKILKKNLTEAAAIAAAFTLPVRYCLTLIPVPTFWQHGMDDNQYILGQYRTDFFKCIKKEK